MRINSTDLAAAYAAAASLKAERDELKNIRIDVGLHQYTVYGTNRYVMIKITREMENTEDGESYIIKPMKFDKNKILEFDTVNGRLYCGDEEISTTDIFPQVEKIDIDFPKDIAEKTSEQFAFAFNQKYMEKIIKAIKIVNADEHPILTYVENPHTPIKFMCRFDDVFVQACLMPVQL